jgi:hypothetical protein
MNYLLFGLEILLIAMAIALVPARSKQGICRSRVIYNGRASSKPRAHSNIESVMCGAVGAGVLNSNPCVSLDAGSSN